MARQEFKRSVKVEAVKRTTRNGVTYCEGCGLPARRWHYDHIIPDGLGGKPTVENCKLLCLPCHATKTAQDVADIAKAKRREAAHIGIRKEPTLNGAKFMPAPPQRKASRPLAKQSPPRRGLYEDAR
jgi:5-methylcytosine-specific restriction enzyme A